MFRNQNANPDKKDIFNDDFLSHCYEADDNLILLLEESPEKNNAPKEKFPTELHLKQSVEKVSINIFDKFRFHKEAPTSESVSTVSLSNKSDSLQVNDLIKNVNNKDEVQRDPPKTGDDMVTSETALNDCSTFDIFFEDDFSEDEHQIPPKNDEKTYKMSCNFSSSISLTDGSNSEITRKSSDSNSMSKKAIDPFRIDLKSMSSQKSHTVIAREKQKVSVLQTKEIMQTSLQRMLNGKRNSESSNSQSCNLALGNSQLQRKTFLPPLQVKADFSRNRDADLEKDIDEIFELISANRSEDSVLAEKDVVEDSNIRRDHSFTPVKYTHNRHSFGPNISRKRKFPGPAGLLPDVNVGSGTPVLENCLSKTIVVEDSFNQELLCSQDSVEEFLCPAWQTMLRDFSSDFNILNKFCIKQIWKRTFRKKMPKHVEAELFCAMVKEISYAGDEVTAIFKDQTGEIPGQIDWDIVEKYSEILNSGSVLVLRKAKFLCNQLKVKVTNLVSIYDREGKQTLHISNYKEKMSNALLHEKVTTVGNFGERLLSSYSAESESETIMHDAENFFEDDMDDLLKDIDV